MQHRRNIMSISVNQTRVNDRVNDLSNESMANAKAMERAMRAESDARNKSFWGKLGDRVLSGIDAIGEAFSED